MRRLFFRGLILGCIAFTSLAAMAQSSAATETCLQKFRESFGNLRNPSSGKDQVQGISIKYRVTIHTADGESYSDNIQLISGSKKSKVTTSELTIFQDENAMVTIQESEQRIFMTRSTDTDFRKSQFNMFMSLQDSIVSLMTLKQCTVDGQVESYTAGKPCQKLLFSLPASLKGLGVSSVTYWIDEERRMIKKVLLNYSHNEDRLMKSLAFEFDTIDNQYKGIPFDGSAVARVLDGKKLKPAYSNYHLIDQR